MMGFAGSSLAMFAAVWALLCGLSGALVVDAMLRTAPEPPAAEVEAALDTPAVEA